MGARRGRCFIAIRASVLLVRLGKELIIWRCGRCPCLRCTVKIVQCGVREVVYSLSYSMDAASRRVMEEAGVGLRQIEMPDFPRG